MNGNKALRHSFKCAEVCVFDRRPNMPREFVMHWLGGDLDWCRKFLRSRYEVGAPLDHTQPRVEQ